MDDDITQNPVLVFPPTLDLYTLSMRYGVFIFSYLRGEKIDPLKKSIKHTILIPWSGIVAWELIDIDKPRRIVLLTGFCFLGRKPIFLGKILLNYFSFLEKKKVNVSIGWFTVIENPFDRRSRVFDELVEHLRRYAGGKEVKGLEKYGTYPLVKKHLEKCETIDYLRKNVDEVLGEKTSLLKLAKLVFMEAIVDALGPLVPRSWRERVAEGLIEYTPLAPLRVAKKVGMTGFDVYFTDKGLAIIPDAPELDLPRERIYWKLDKNDPLVQKIARILDIKPKHLTKELTLYVTLRSINFKPITTFWGFVREDKTTPNTHRASKIFIEKVRNKEIEWSKEIHLGCDIRPLDKYIAKEVLVDKLLYTVFLSFETIPFVWEVHFVGVRWDEEDKLHYCLIDKLWYGSPIIESVFPEPLKKPREAHEKYTLKDYYERISRIAVDEETMSVLKKMFLGERVPDEIADKIHSEYERITKEARAVEKQILKMKPEKYIPLLYYLY